MSRGKRKEESKRDLRSLIPDCVCQSESIDEFKVADKVFWAYRKLAALAEVMDNYTPSGERGAFGGEKYEHLEYPDKINGLGDILMGIAAELAWLHDKIGSCGDKLGR